MVATVVARNVHDFMAVPVVRSNGICFWRESRVWSQAVGFVSVRL
jgi:hypothetical protein